jgi:ABC-2 type transport system ATP-binding protein
MMLSCRALSKRYGGADGVLALDGLDLDVPAGSIFGLLGPNGAGKTTTLRLFSGIARQTAGTIAIDGRPMSPEATDLRRSIGVLDQAPRFYGWMRGQELVEFAGRLSGLDDRTARRRTAEVLDRVGLTGAARRRIGAYSGGMRQRLGIASALVGEPTLLLLDEPVSSLDPSGRRDLLTLIADLRGSATVILSTHVLDDVERICDRVGILADGRLAAESSLDELLARFSETRFRLEPAPGQEAAVAAMVDTIVGAPWCESVDAEAGAVVVAGHDEAALAAGLLPLVVAAGVRLDRLERVQPTLEDVFLRIVGQDGRGGPG